MSDPDEKILITGVGLVTSLGLDLPTTWAGILAGRCGIGPSTSLEQMPVPDRGVGQAPELPKDFMPGEEREIRYLRWAIVQALHHAQLDPAQLDPAGSGAMFGTTLHGMRAAGRFFRDDDPESLRDFQAAAVLNKAAAGLNARAWAATTCAACASGLASIALGATLLRAGQLDLVIAGGYDPISEYAYAGFNSLRLVSESPQRPFARNRSGMKLAEGYGVVILERASDAARRNAPVFVELLGCGASADAHHLSQPHPEGAGAARAMLEMGVTPVSVDMIAGHATATPDNDGAEYRALRAVFGERLPRIPVTAFKSHLGHSLGAAGAVELILAAQSLRERVVPPVANVRAEDVEFEDLQLVTEKPRPADLRRAMVISLGFGGSNACAVIQKPETLHAVAAVQAPSPKPQAAVFITGIGVVLPGAVGNEAFISLLNDPGRAAVSGDAGAVDESQLLAHLNARRVRRLSEYVKLSLAATAVAMRDAGIPDIAVYPGRCGAILGTAHGSAGFSEEYYRQIVGQGIDAANPLLFAEGVPNAGSAHLSMMLNLKGPCQTLVGSRTAGLDALALAAARIGTGEWDCAIVNAADEYSPLVNRAYGHCGLYSPANPGRPFVDSTGFAVGAGSVTLVLESRASLEKRGAKARGQILSFTQTTWPVPPLPDAFERIAEMLGRLGPTGQVFGSAHATWMDRMESLAVRRAFGKGVNLSTLYGTLAECFAPMPLASLAAALLTGRPPRSETPCGAFTVLCGDYNGVTTAMNVAPLST